MEKPVLKSMLLVSLVPVIALCGCSGTGANDPLNSDEVTTTSATTGVNDSKVGYQLERPQDGEEVAVISTDMGTIKLRFFPDVAPKACENFKTHARDGYYDGLLFHRVINNFMVQTGDPKGNGTGGESIWKEPFEDEFSENLFNITGAVAMANSGKDTNGSQFFINQGNSENFVGFDRFQEAYEEYKKNPDAFTAHYGSVIDMSKMTEKIKKIYADNGGNPFLDGAFSTAQKGHTVFAQVFEGMDTVNKIANAKTNEHDRPIKDIFIKNIKIVNYEG